MHENNVYIFILTCMFALSVLFRYTHAACLQDSNGLKRFGSECNYMCHCKNATEQCSDADGTCTTSGCANAWMGHGCQYRDIAFDEYSRAKDNIYPPQYSYRASDGDISTCSRTSFTSNKPWWRLWLPRKELITGLVLITETDKLSNFKKFKVTVEEVAIADTKTSYTRQQTCYTYPNMNPPSKTIDVTCDQPLIDNQVRITLDGTSTQLVICDIRIYGGKNLAFGKQTSQSSYGPNSISARTVDGIIGSSSDKCSSTHSEDNPWWSTDLGYIMRIQTVRISTYTDEGLLNFQMQAKNDSSDTWKTIYDDNGKYTPTKNFTIFEEARYLRLFIPRSSVQLILCEVQIFGECTSGRWGPGCDFPCNCLNADVCSVQTGHCPKGCKDGFKATPTCQTECDDGTFGSDCTATCGQCKNGAICHKANGSCPNGCAPGWHGNICKDKCYDGYYGIGCKNMCSNNCKDNQSCGKTDGICECKAGWKGSSCDQACSNGRWGDNCSSECGHCLTGTCDGLSGICDGGCQPGYKYVPHCSDECSDGSYGISCLGTCGNCKGGIANCEKVTGTCILGCAEGFVGYGCIEGAPSPLAAIIGGVSAAIVVVAVVLVVVFVFRRRRQNLSNTQGIENQHDAVPSVSYIADNPANKYDALQVTLEEVNPYDTLDTTTDTTTEDTGDYEAMES